jgi:hypothetical protein
MYTLCHVRLLLCAAPCRLLYTCRLAPFVSYMRFVPSVREVSSPPSYGILHALAPSYLEAISSHALAIIVDVTVALFLGIVGGRKEHAFVAFSL